MTQPHHHVFNALQQSIIKGVNVQAVLPHLVSKGVIPEADLRRYDSKSGMKILIGFLRNRTFEDFLGFVECIFLTQREDPSKSKALPVIDSIIKAVEDFDQRMNTGFAAKVIAIKSTYMASASVCVGAEAEADTALKLSSMQVSSTQSDGFPKGLGYVGAPVVHSFDSKGGQLCIPECGFSITVPEEAVAPDQVIVVKAAICIYGPFSISEKYRLASDFVVIVSDGSFEKPVDVQMGHCLLMSEYKKSSEVVILRADHLAITEDGLYTFDDFTNPEISADHPTLSFQVQSFCIFCDAIKVGNLKLVSNPSIDDDNLSSALSSFDESGEYAESPPTKYSTAGSRHSSKHSPSHPQEEKSFDNESENVPPIQKLVLGKRKSHPHRSSQASRILKPSCQQSCQPEYCAMIFEPKISTINLNSKFYKFIIFIALNTPGAIKVCESRAQEILHSSVQVNIIPITFDSELKSLQLEVEDLTLGWSVEPDKTPTVSYSEVQFHMLSANELSQRIAQKTCPPRIVFDADYDEASIKRLSCKIWIRGASKATTDDSVFFRINVRPNRFLRQDAVDVPTLTSSPLPSNYSISSWISSVSTSGKSPSLGFQSPTLKRSISNSSQGSVVINTPHVNVYNVSDHEVEADGRPNSVTYVPLETYKDRLSRDALATDVSDNLMRCIIMEHVSRWKYLARLGFELSEGEVRRIESNHKSEGVEECGVQAFWKWRKSRRSSKIYSIEALEIFHKSKEYDAIEALIVKLEKQVENE